MSESNATAPAAPAATSTPTTATPAAPAASHAVAPNVTVNIAQPAATSPAASPAPAATAPQSPPAAAAPVVESEPQAGNEPGWLKARLERERKATLKGLGVESEEDAKSAISAERARREAEKTELQKAQEQASQAATLKKRNEALLSVLSQQATATLSGLTAEQRGAVTAVAGDDPAEQLRIYNVMRATWAAPAAPPIAATPAVPLPASPAAPAVAPQAPAAPAAPAVLPPPANTMPANAAPHPANAPPKTHAEVYAALKADPAQQFRAAEYLRKFMRQIYAAPPNQPTK